MKEVPNVAISACAGSGKTHQLIERLLALLKGGAAPGEILAITFTRKAAQEMRDRLQQRLQESSEDWARDCLRRMLLAEEESDKLSITTFHGWFSILLAGRRWSRGRYGPAELCEDEAPLCADAWRRWQEKAPAQETAIALRECSPLTLRELFTGDLMRHHNAWRLHKPDADAAPDMEASRERLRTALSRFAARCRPRIKDDEAAQQAALDFEDNPTDAQLEKTETAFFTGKGEPRKRLRTSAEKQDNGLALEHVFTALKGHLDAAAKARVLQFDAHMRVLAQGYLDELAAVKAEQHKMSYNDLEYESQQAVGEAGGDVNALLYRIHRRFRHVLIDEFQDTSPLQWQVVKSWLHAAHGSEDAPSLFIVGDVKQAIYRFRYGDARLFGAAQEFAAAHYRSELKESNTCYRLAPPLLEFVNALFPLLLEDDFAAHEVSAQTRGLRGRVEWHEFVPPAADAAAPRRMRNPLRHAAADDDRRRQWARAVAEKTRQIIGNWQVQDKGDAAAAPRPAQAADILLLLPAFTHAALLRRALQQQGLAVSMQGGQPSASLVSRDIAALLTALLAPENRLSLAHALMSPLFSLSEADIAPLALAEEGGLWEAVQKSAQPAVRAAAAQLAKWRGWAQDGALPAHDLLQRIFAEGQVPARYRAAVPPPLRQQAEAELLALLDLSLGQDGGRQPLLWQFLQALPAKPGGGGGDAVRLMTVHAAKGLESPIVLLADCGFGIQHSGSGRQSVQLLVDWQPNDAAPCTVVFRPAHEKRAFAEVAETERDLAEREYDNLFYVALTRAQQALVIFSLGRDSETPRDNRCVAALRQTMQAHAAKQGDAWVLGDDIAGGGDDAAAAAPESAGDDAPPPPARIGEITGGAAQRQAGEILHQQAALLLRGVDEARVAAATGAPADDARALLQNDELQALLRAGTHCEVEAEFINNGKVQRVDLLVFHPDGIWVIDYKSGGGDLARYREQMQGYLATVAAAYPDKPVQGAFVTPRGFHPAAAE